LPSGYFFLALLLPLELLDEEDPEERLELLEEEEPEL
jgi:hypothetical protein